LSWLQSHFSITRAAAVLGIGTDNVVTIRVDERLDLFMLVIDSLENV